jgi:hypothetical protein
MSFPSYFSSQSSSSDGDGFFSNSTSSSSGSSSSSPSYFSRFTSSFGSSSDVSGSKDFLESNTLIAKIAFLLLVIILFFILLRICISLLSWLLAPSQNMTLVSGIVDATQPIIISQDTSSQSSMPIIRSTNQTEGMEFTWSIWIFLKPVTAPPSSQSPQHIFSKGIFNSGSVGSGKCSPFSNNAPGLYLSGANTLLVVMDSTTTPGCITGTNIPVTIDNMPINKWFNVVIRLTNNNLDVYINGRLTERKTFTDGVPNQNYDDVYICKNGGFNGYIADLKYYNSSIGTSEINSIVSSGPNTSIDTSSLKNNMPPYLSGNWYDEKVGFRIEYK